MEACRQRMRGSEMQIWSILFPHDIQNDHRKSCPPCMAKIVCPPSTLQPGGFDVRLVSDSTHRAGKERASEWLQVSMCRLQQIQKPQQHTRCSINDYSYFRSIGNDGYEKIVMANDALNLMIC